MVPVICGGIVKIVSEITLQGPVKLPREKKIEYPYETKCNYE